MTPICLGAYATEQDALDALAGRPEAHDQLRVVEDGDGAHPWRLWWDRST